MWTVLYGILLLLLIPASAYSLHNQFTIPVLFSSLLAFIGVGRAFLDALSKDNLHVYFALQRLRLWWHSDFVARWWIAARFDGNYSPEVVGTILDYFRDPARFKFSSQVDFQNSREAQIQIDETLILRVSYDRPEDGDTASHVTILSKTVEVSYGHTKAKLEKQIVPVLVGLKDLLTPASSSYELDVEFGDRNPFFAVYVAHLRPDQIGDFKVVLRPHTCSAAIDQDKLEISKSALHITTGSTESFRKLAVDFVLLSPDVRCLTGESHA
jgi:hypothetical protein